MSDSLRPANRVDDEILARAATQSPQEISFALGGIISPAKVAAHTQTLLASKDWLTAAQMDQLVTIRMNNLLIELESKYRDLDNAALRLKVLDKIGDRLDKRRAATDMDLNKLYGNQGVIMGRIVDIAMNYMRGALSKEIDAERWDSTLSDAMAVAQAEISKYEAGADSIEP